MDNKVFKKFIKYVSLNVLGMIGLSCYILADTFFIANALGATGIAALNLSISVYSVIHGTGLMLGIGGATRYSILMTQNNKRKANEVFSTCIKLGILIGTIYASIGVFGSKALAIILGADASTLPLTKTYLMTILCFAPFFIMNNIILAFVRNDNNPKLSMIAMLTGSLSNIILDYIFMYPLNLGMFGAAFATGLAPIISLVILSTYFIRKKNGFRFVNTRIIWSTTINIFSIGLSAFITEISSGIVLITFNLIILGITGNIGVAAYGIIANIALVVIAIFTGIAQGIQPLISKAYALGKHKAIKKVLEYAVLTSILISILTYLGMVFNADKIIKIFNSEKNIEIEQIARVGIGIYFIGFLFAGINIILTMYLSATEYVKDAFIISIARGCLLILPLVLILSHIFGMGGVWMAFVCTEAIITIAALAKSINNKRSLLK